MKPFPVSNVGQFGIINDLQPHEIPLNAWSGGQNIRFRDGYVEKFKGYSEVFATPLWAPYWLLPAAFGTSYFWIYASLTKVGATNMASHGDITRVAGNYAATADINWTGDVLGGLPVLTNGVDVPQVWNTPSLSTPLVNLPNWPANYSCRSLRTFKQFLVALDIVKATGTRYPSLVKWSHPADPLTVPTSWDETDPTKDAGEFNLSETGDTAVDSVSLRDIKVIYKERSTWGMQFIGGVNVFRIYKIFDSFGAFTARAVAEFLDGQHIVFTGDDVVVHDGQASRSVLHHRLRKFLAGQIDSTHYRKSFLALNYGLFEAWVCFPSTGNTHANKALVWNWKENTWGVRELPSSAFIASGIIDPSGAASTWDADAGSWDADASAWDDLAYNPTLRRMLAAIPGSTKLLMMDDTQQQAGSNMTSYVERTGLGFPLKVEQPPDFTTRKLMKGLWPRLEGTNGGVVNIYIGAQEKIGGPVTYSDPFPFILGQSVYVDRLVEGPLHALKFESATNIEWRLHGYEADVSPVGNY